MPGKKIIELFERMREGEITNLEGVHDFVHDALNVKEEKLTSTNTPNDKIKPCLNNECLSNYPYYQDGTHCIKLKLKDMPECKNYRA